MGREAGVAVLEEEVVGGRVVAEDDGDELGDVRSGGPDPGFLSAQQHTAVVLAAGVRREVNRHLAGVVALVEAHHADGLALTMTDQQVARGVGDHGGKPVGMLGEVDDLPVAGVEADVFLVTPGEQVGGVCLDGAAQLQVFKAEGQVTLEDLLNRGIVGVHDRPGLGRHLTAQFRIGDQMVDGTSDLVAGEPAHLAQTQHHAGVDQGLGRRPLIVGQHNHNRGQAEDATLPGGCSARTKGKVGGSHQLGHVAGLDMQAHPLLAGTTGTQDLHVRVDCTDDHIDLQVAPEAWLQGVKGQAGEVVGIGATVEDEYPVDAAVARTLDGGVEELGAQQGMTGATQQTAVRRQQALVALGELSSLYQPGLSSGTASGAPALQKLALSQANAATLANSALSGTIRELVDADTLDKTLLLGGTTLESSLAASADSPVRIAAKPLPASTSSSVYSQVTIRFKTV